jgi:hypothetical protein
MTTPSIALQCKLGSLLVHVEEANSPGSYHIDFTVIQSLMSDPEIVAWMEELRKNGFLPVKRS